MDKDGTKEGISRESSNKKSPSSPGGGWLTRRRSSELHHVSWADGMTIRHSVDSFPLSPLTSSTSLGPSTLPLSRIVHREEESSSPIMTITSNTTAATNGSSSGLSSILTSPPEMTFDQLDDILRFEERLRYNYIILKRIQFKYVVLLCFLLVWALNSLIRMYITGSRWQTRSLYLSCSLLILFFIMGFYREKITRPSK
jgi:hypothetical protein